VLQYIFVRKQSTYMTNASVKGYETPVTHFHHIHIQKDLT